MAGEWRESKVGEEADIFLGFAFKSAEFATEPPGHRLVRGDNVKRGTIEWGDKSRYWRDVTPDLNRYRLRVGDVVVGMDGSRVGENFARISEDDLPALLVQRVACLRGRRDLDQAFLRYLICNPDFTAYVKAVHTGTSIPHVSGTQIGAYPIPVPPLPEQRSIAHILGTLDDKIELNRRMNETLEAIARALFKSWFVDFDPIRAKAEGRDPGLPQPLADLFPDSFEDSELGEIPKGWGIRPVSDLADVVGVTTPSTKVASYWVGGTHAWATPKDLSGLSVPVLLDTERQITDAGLSQVGSGLLPKGTVLLSSRAPIGYLAVAEVPVAINQGFIAMRPKSGTSSLFLLLWASAAHDEIVSRANGSTFLEISKASFRPIPVVAPPALVMLAFEKQAQPLYQRIVASARESQLLTAFRDSLLPKLISGELRARGV